MRNSGMEHIEKHWQTLTCASNVYFEEGNYQHALSGYEEALCHAEQLNNYIGDCIRLKIPFIQVYIISCNNIANTYKELNKHEDAEKMLERIVYYLLHVANNKKLNFDEIQAELKRSTLAYVSFVEKTIHGKRKQEQIFQVIKEQFSAKN